MLAGSPLCEIPMLAYIHVPFCRSRCHYCAFHSEPIGKISGSKTPAIQTWLETVLLEIAHYGDKFPNTPIHSVFFGGGTPSLLPGAAVDAIMDRLGKAFKIAPRAEITLEANPESLRGKNALPDYLASGVNRLSIGVQSLEDETLRMLGRPHKAQDSLQAIYAARTAGFANVSIDLMWGLPNQSVRQWLQTLKDATRLAPDHISAYGLSLEPGTKLEQLVENGNLVLPPERDQSIMFMEGAAFLESHGYLQYEISNFGRMGYQCRHNLGYWEGMDYLGFGPSATSTVGDKRWTNPASLAAWANLIAKGEFGRQPEILTPRTRLLELIMLRLRTARGLRLRAYRDLTGRDFIRDHQKMIQTLHENGLARIRNGYLSLTRSGMLVSNAILGNLFEAVQTSLEHTTQAMPPQTPVPEINEIKPQPVIWPQADDHKKSLI